MEWRSLLVLVSGGASFIGSHLAHALAARGARVRIADNLSSGTLSNVQSLLDGGAEFIHADLRELNAARAAMRGVDVVFHLAADHGGRGYITRHQAACATNFLLDGSVIMAAHEVGVRKFVLASSGCVYPTHLQANAAKEVYLHEDMVRPPYDADNTYGWAKLMAELTLKAYYVEHGLPSAACRYFTVYGPRGGESHAIHAMIARAYLRQDPFDIWGDGRQVRNWTYVDDIVRGTILAAERIGDASAVNLGTRMGVTVLAAARAICDHFGYQPYFRFLPDMPTGPVNRVADDSRARELLGWRPETSFAEGIAHTVDWYCRTHAREEVNESLPRLLLQRV